MEGTDFLREKYKLHTSKEVAHAAQRTEARTGEKLSLMSDADNNARIQNYLDRLDQIINPQKLSRHPDFDRTQRNLAMLKEDLYDEFVIKPQEIPEAYFESIKRRHKEEGQGNIEISADYREELSRPIINDQKTSLDNWVDYLTSDDAKYPDWLKYYAFRSVLQMGRYDKEKKKFTERYGGSISPFPELNREALAIVLSDIETHESHSGGDQRCEFTKRFDIAETSKQQYRQYLRNKNFAKLYGLAIDEFKPISEDLLQTTKGEWVKYLSGSDPKLLVQSIVNYGTGWCLRGEEIARRYLVHDHNDLHVFYSFDKDGKPTVPRAVMVVNQNNKITEIRGVASEENLDPYIGQVVDEKLNEPEFKTEGLAYKKKSADMKLLTRIEQKNKNNQQLTKDDLTFLYEIHSSIEGFGYQKDPRIQELISQRNTREDMLIILDCAKDQIAYHISEIKPDTKAYVGILVPHIFDKIRQYHIEHIYTSFPEGKITLEKLKIGGKTKQQLLEDMIQQQVNINDNVKFMLNSKDFKTLKDEETIDLVRLKVKDLNFKDSATTKELFERIKEYDLALCPAEVGPHYGLSHMNEQLGEWITIGMSPIIGADGFPRVFHVERGDDGFWLRSYWTGPRDRRDPLDGFVFRLNKLKT